MAKKHIRRGGSKKEASVLEGLGGLWDMGAGALRGFTAQALGAPGDLEGLLDVLGITDENAPRRFYDTDDWLESLPATGRDTKVAEGLGANVVPLGGLVHAPAGLRALGRGAKQVPAAAKAAAARIPGGLATLAERMTPLPSGSPAAQVGAIKPRGGNWLKYEQRAPAGTNKSGVFTQEAIPELASILKDAGFEDKEVAQLFGRGPEQIRRRLEVDFNQARVRAEDPKTRAHGWEQRLEQLRGVLQKFNEWEKKYPGEKIRDISGLDTNLETISNTHAGEVGPHASALHEWTNKNLRRYLMTNWGTEDDPLADLLVEYGRRERGGPAWAQPPRWGGSDTADHVENFRMGDYMRAPGVEGDLRDTFTGTTIMGNSIQDRRWRGSGPKELMQSVVGAHRDYGYGDEFAELKHALPSWVKPEGSYFDLDVGPGSFHDQAADWLEETYDYLRTLPPERIKNVSVPDAFRGARRYHEELARKAEKDLGPGGLRGKNSVIHKEYPSGYRWAKLVDKEDLDYEGQAMGHCVGSYCDLVQGGRTEIYSLRDPQGRPHVTVEVSPGRGLITPGRPVSIQAAAKISPKVLEDFNQWFKEQDFHSMHYADKMHEWLQAEHPELYTELTSPGPASIRQIKGKQNAAPIEDYLPYVQDFVKSGDWADVRDLRNSGLMKIEDPSRKMNRAGLMQNWINADVPEAEQLRRRAAWDEYRKAAWAKDPDQDSGSEEFLRGFLESQGEKVPKPWKRPAAYVAPEDLLPYARYNTTPGTALGPAETPTWVPMGEAEGLDPGSRALLLQQALEGRTRDRIRLEFPDDFEGFAEGGRVKSRKKKRPALADEIGPILRRVEEYNELPTGLLDHLIDKESAWDPRAVSPRGAQGLFQFMPATAKGRGLRDPFDPYESAWHAGAYLKELAGKFGGLDKGLMAYNWGQGNLSKYGVDKVPPQVQSYARNILAGLDMSALPTPAKPIIMAEQAAQALAPGQPPVVGPGVSEEDDGAPQLSPEAVALLQSLLADEEEV